MRKSNRNPSNLDDLKFTAPVPIESMRKQMIAMFGCDTVPAVRIKGTVIPSHKLGAITQ